MRNLSILSLAVLLICHLPCAQADRKADFRAAYQSYQQAMGAGDTTGALESGKRAYKLGAKVYGRDDINTAKLAINYATLLNDTGEFKKARKILKGRLAVMESKYGQDAMDLIALLIELGRAEFDVDDVEESLAYFDRASDLVGRQDQALYRAKKNTDIAKILRDRGGAVHSRPYVEAAYWDYQDILQPEDLRLGMASYEMAMWSMKDRDLVAAVDYFNAALTAFDGAGPMNQGELSVRQLLVDVLSRLGREDEATPHCVALGEHQDVTQPPKVLFEAPVGVERGQLRDVMGGEITVAFTVDVGGFVSNPRITSSTAEILNEAVLEAVSQFRYAPHFVDGKPAAMEEVSFTFSFDMGGRMERRGRFNPARNPGRGVGGGGRSGGGRGR